MHQIPKSTKDSQELMESNIALPYKGPKTSVGLEVCLQATESDGLALVRHMKPAAVKVSARSPLVRTSHEREAGRQPSHAAASQIVVHHGGRGWNKRECEERLSTGAGGSED